MGTIIMATVEDPWEPRAELLRTMMRMIDTAPEAAADSAGQAGGTEADKDNGQAAETRTTMTAAERERGRVPRSSSRDGAA